MSRPAIVVLTLLGAAFAGRAQTQTDQLDIPRSSVPGLVPALTWNETFTPLSFKGKLKYHMYAAFGPYGLMRSAAFAGLDQWRKDPEEWGYGWNAYGQRVGSRVAVNGVRRGLQAVIGGLRGEDPRFFRSGETGTWPRIRNQLKQTVIVRTDSGGTTFALGRISSAMAAAQLSQAWQPRTRDGWGENAGRAAIVIGADTGLRMLREFWPDIKAKLRRNR